MAWCVAGSIKHDGSRADSGIKVARLSLREESSKGCIKPSELLDPNTSNKRLNLMVLALRSILFDGGWVGYEE